MQSDERKKRDEELDRFWDIDALIPKRHMPHPASDTETSEIVLEPKERREPAGEKIPAPKDEPKRHFIPPHTADEVRRQPDPEDEYTPDNALIRRVRIYPRKSSYRYYEGFARDAARLYEVRGGECPRVPFFSYVPQYTQMNRPQLEWYLWWRTCLREGAFPDTDYSYILLYIYEIINLPERINAQEARDMLCRVWVHYRDTFHQLDSYLPEWICDFSLIHHLPPPDICTGDLLSAIMAHCTLKEFYVPLGGEDGYIRALLTFCSNYDYRKSKFCTGDHAALFERAIKGALKRIVERMSQEGRLFSSAGMDDSKLVREAYTGALCSYRIKRRIEVEYCSFSRSHELRYFVTDVVKYTENKIRACLGIRSRLSIYALPVSTRETLDRYLQEILPAAKSPSRAKQQMSAEYEKLYDLPAKALSLSDAAKIEKQSWDTTERLIEAFEDVGEADPTPFPENAFSLVQGPTALPQTDDASCAPPENGQMHVFAAYKSFLLAVHDGNAAGQTAAAREAGLPIEVLADEVNGLSADLMGDILLEEDNGVFRVIEDYTDFLEEILRS